MSLTTNQTVSLPEPLRARLASLELPLATVERLGGASGYFGRRALCWVVGLNPTSLSPLQSRDWLGMAARTCSVSSRAVLPASELAQILSSGDVADQYWPHIQQLLDEVPVQIVVLAAESVAIANGIRMAELWRNVERLGAIAGAETRNKWSALGQK